MRRTHRALISCFLGTLAALSPGLARAVDPPPSTAEQNVRIDKAATLYDEGLAFRKASKWVEAHASFLAAWSLFQHWQTAANLADCEIELGRPREAAEHARFYLRHTTPDRRERAEQLLKAATAKIATLTVNVAPAEAEVLIDGAAVGRAPLADPLFVEPGRRKVVARYPGMPDAVEILDLAAGSTRSVSLVLLAVTPGPPVEYEPDAGVKKGILIGGAALTAIFLAGGVAFTVVSNGKASDADTMLGELQSRGGAAPCQSGPLVSDCETLADLNRESVTFHDLAIAGYVAAGITAAATLTYGLWPKGKAPERVGMRAVPWIGGGSGGVVLTGGF